MEGSQLQMPFEDYRRYGRQMILPGFGLPAQLRLQDASVVVVGAGGLGCPALQYLAASGIGRIAIIDHDTVEISNLQRQILHSEEKVGNLKAESASQAIRQLNSRVKVDVHAIALDSSNAESLLASHDVILDCSDNSPTRYLLSDTAIKLAKPLVSGAAQKFDGQLCIYNMDLGIHEGRGPCYRCLFPKPAAPELSASCEETGILGAVTGIIGTLQAVEAIKIITGLHDQTPTMLIYSALGSPPFRSIKLRKRKKTCLACGDEGERIGAISSLDYVAFCGGPTPNWEERGLAAGDSKRRIRAAELYQAVVQPDKSVRILDVRPTVEYGICHLPFSINVPLPEILANPDTYVKADGYDSTIVVCRLGNDSQIAADALRASSADQSASAAGAIVDLIGGLTAWSKDVDSRFPIY